MPKLKFTDPEAVVAAFIRQMHMWEMFAGTFRDVAESRFNPANESTLHPVEVRLNELFKLIPPFLVEMFLTKRPPGYQPGCSYSTPPEYDPKAEKVIRAIPKTKTQVVVETDRKSPFGDSVREYTLKLQDGNWLIDSVAEKIGDKKRKLTLF